jgi:hypothetical protein
LNFPPEWDMFPYIFPYPITWPVAHYLSMTGVYVFYTFQPTRETSFRILPAL